MASGIDVKMGVSGVSQFRSAMNQSSQSVKTLDAALKLNEKQLQATGDKETYMAQKSKLLQQQIAAQSNVVKQGQAALQAMEKNGVDPASAAYQKLQQQVLNAQTALLGMQTDLGGVGQTATETAQQTDKLANSLNSINKKVSFDAVLGGIGKITSAMETAGKKVAAMATDVWNTMTAAASWADNESTLASMYGISVEQLQKMQRVAETSIQTPVEAIIKARQRIGKEYSAMTDQFKDALIELGFGTYNTKYSSEVTVQQFENVEDAMWAYGEAIMAVKDEFKQEELAQQIFGRSWREMIPLFDAGREAYEEALETQSVVAEENVQKLADLNLAVNNLKGEYETLKETVLAQFAGPLTKAADSLAGVLQKVNEYLETPEGKEKLEALGEAAEKLFSGIININADDALETAKGWLDGITGALGWIGEHWKDVETGIKAIGAAFLGLKLAEVVGSLVQGALALKNLMGGGAASAAGQGAAAAAGGSLLGKAAKGVGSFLGSAAGKLSGVLGGIMIANEIMYGDPLTFIPSTGNDDIYGETGIYKPGSPEYQAWIAEQEQFAREAEAEKKVRAQMDKDQAEGKARTEAEIARADAAFEAAEAAREKAWVDEQMEEAKEAAREWAEEYERQLQARWDAIEPAEPWSVVSGQAQAAESPEDKLARIFGFSNDQELMEAYDRYKEELNDYFNENPSSNIFDYYASKGLGVDDYMRFTQMWKDAKERLEVPAEPQFDPDVGQQLQDQLSGVELHVTVVPDMVGTGVFSDEEEDVAWHANGLPFVPFDGYIAALHRGERVLTANQNRSYTTNSNVYFDHVNVGGGVDADGLAARIAERTRRAMSGFGG